MRRGFTLIEIVIVMGIMGILMGLGTVSLLRSQRRAGVNEAAQVLISDLRSQQTKAMTGVTVGGTVPVGFGIYFEANRYILFSGSSYNSSDSMNAEVSISAPSAITNIGFPGNAVVFLARSGEVAGFTPSGNSVTIEEDGGQAKTIQVNKYGIVL